MASPLLEREFYAVSHPADEFVEIPRWVRLLSDRLGIGGPRLSRRDTRWSEALGSVCAVVAFAGSFLASDHARAAVRTSSIVALLCSYLAAVFIRHSDKYKLWPGAENAPRETPRTWKSIAAEYVFFVAVGTFGLATAAWLMP